MANARYQLLKDTYMPLDGQWRIVLSGTVFDDDTSVPLRSFHRHCPLPGRVRRCCLIRPWQSHSSQRSFAPDEP